MVDSVIEESPFIDHLDRIGQIETFTRIIRNPAYPTVLSIEGGYGVGKSTFATLWKAHLEREGESVIIFDARTGEADADPLMGFLGQLAHYGLTRDVPGTTLRKRFTNIVAAGGRAGLKGLFRDGAKDVQQAGGETLAALREMIPAGERGGGYFEGLRDLLGMDPSSSDQDSEADGERSQTTPSETGSKIRNALSDAAAGEIVDYALAALARQGALKETLAALREDLTGDSERRVVIMIDELDRCRPDYALGLLEAIKGLFDEAGFTFILFISPSRLESTAATRYGKVEEGEPYLAKFIDLRLSLGSGSLDTLLLALLDDLPEYTPWGGKDMRSTIDGRAALVANLQPSSAFTARTVKRAVDSLRITLMLYPARPVLLDLLVSMALHARVELTPPGNWHFLVDGSNSEGVEYSPLNNLRRIDFDADSFRSHETRLLDLFGEPHSDRREAIMQNILSEFMPDGSKHPAHFEQAVIDYHSQLIVKAQRIVADDTVPEGTA